MKIRKGFVSNSSSSSFVVEKKNLTSEQIDKIRNHVQEAEKLGLQYFNDGWEITETNDRIEGFTWMDNLDMYSFLNKIGVRDEHIFGDSEHGTWPNEGWQSEWT